MKQSFPFITLFLLLLGGCSSLSAPQWKSEVRQALTDDNPIITHQIIRSLGVDALNTTGHTPAGRCCFRLQTFETDTGLKVHEIIYLNDRSSLELVDYQGRLLSAKYYDNYTHSSGHYWAYDHRGWSDFAQAIIGQEESWMPPDFSDTLPEKSQAYYRLINVLGGRNEYGWICEYSTVGMAPEQREAILLLLKQDNMELVRQVLRGPNLEGKLYAADALLYLDSQGISLSNDDRQIIDELRNSEAEVQTCGNAGSYRIYLKAAHKVLSDSAVARIPEMYNMLAELGYWKVK